MSVAVQCIDYSQLIWSKLLSTLSTVHTLLHALFSITAFLALLQCTITNFLATRVWCSRNESRNYLNPATSLLCNSTSVPLPNHRPAPFRKEVIQPHLPVRLPCYDFVPVISPTLGSSLLAVKWPTSGVTNSHDVTGGVYKTRERIQRSVLTYVY